MNSSSINLKALNRAKGPVQRFRALRATNACTPPPHQIIYIKSELRGKIVKNKKLRKLLLSSQMHITIHLTLKVGSNPSHVTPYFILGWNRWNVWFGMKECSGPPGCILYLSSFSSEYTWVLFNRPNGHWVTPGQPSNTLFKSHNTQAQDLWTSAAKAKGGGLGYFTL